MLKNLALKHMNKILMTIVMMMTVSSYAQISNAKLVASGLTCSMCSKAIYEALQKVNTIESVKANIKESSYDIVFKKDVLFVLMIFAKWWKMLVSLLQNSRLPLTL